jgi:glycine/D-amino acid oxidase-like deaminating enzyme
MRLSDADVAVIGGGVIGCSVAYYLAKKGAKVTIIERAAIGSGASSVNSGVISMATKKPGAALDLAMASQRLYPELARELGMDIEYLVLGSLVVAETETEAGFIEELAAAQRAAGVPVETVTAERCRVLNPLLEGRILSGMYCPTDAQSDPFKVTQAFARAAQNRGAEIVANTRVDAIEATNGRVHTVVTSRGTLRANWIVNAAGAYAPDIGAMVGVKHEVKPRRGQCIILEATEDVPAVRVSSAGQLLAKHGGAPADGKLHVPLGYTSRPVSGTVMLGSTNEFVGYDTRTTREGIAGICASATKLMPRLGRLNAVRAWAGLRPYSATGPILGLAGGPQGYAVAIGHGGDGVALGPITGLYVAEAITREGGCDLPKFLAGLKTAAAA